MPRTNPFAAAPHGQGTDALGFFAIGVVSAVCLLLPFVLLFQRKSRGAQAGSSARSRTNALNRFATVAVGTKNACKLAAVRRALELYPEIAGASAKLEAHSVPSGISEQPMGMETTASGARNRAQAAHAAAAAAQSPGAPVLGLGIESGLFELSGAHYDVCVVSAYDGVSHHLGLSCAFEIPPPILRHVTHGGLDLSEACNASGITSDPQLGEHGGLIGLLSGGRLTREDYTVQALTTAFFFAASDARPWYVRQAAWEGTSEGTVTSPESNSLPTTEQPASSEQQASEHEQPASSEQQASEHSLSGSSEEIETAIRGTWSDERRRHMEDLLIAPGIKPKVLGKDKHGGDII